MAVFGLSLFHFGAPGFNRKTSVFLDWSGCVTGKYYVSTKETPVLRAYVHKRTRDGENFTGNFKDICEHSHIIH